MSDDRQRYLSYLLRVWTVDQNGGRVWRASLESSRTGEQVGFSDLDALFTFLRQCTSTFSEPNAGSFASASPPPNGDPG
jgi:hypothetical protein